MAKVAETAKGNAAVLVAAGAALAFGAATVALAWANTEPERRGAFWLEAGKAGMQLVAVGVVGAAVTAALRAAEEWRAQARQRTADRLDLLRRLRAAYADVKRVRRQLAAAGFAPGGPNPLTAVGRPVYEQGMETLGEANLELEAILVELRARKHQGKAIDEVLRQVQAMEDHLGRCVLQEYRRAWLRLRTAPDGVGGGAIPNALSFSLGDAFGDSYSDPYHVADCLLVAATLAANPSPEAIAACRRSRGRGGSGSGIDPAPCLEPRSSPRDGAGAEPR